jgi:hypothetical protein
MYQKLNQEENIYDWLHQKVPNQVLVEARYKHSTLSGLTPTEKKRRE